MKIGIIFTSFTIFVSFIKAEMLYMDFKDLNISSNDINQIKIIDKPGIPDKYIKKTQKRNLLFANALKKNYTLDENDTAYLKLKAAEAMAKLYIKKKSKIFEPSEADVKSFYIDHKNEFTSDLEAELSIIAVKSLNLADNISAELNMDKSKFESLAKRYSVDGSSEIGGYIGYTKLEKFPYQLRHWIENSKEYQISKPIKAGDYWFILKITDKRLSSTDYEDLKPTIKSLLKRLVKREKMLAEEKALKRGGV